MTINTNIAALADWLGAAFKILDSDVQASAATAAQAAADAQQSAIDAATFDPASFHAKADNLSGIASVGQALINLGGGTAGILSFLASTAADLRSAAGLGSAAVLDAGVDEGDVPVLESGGKLATSVQRAAFSPDYDSDWISTWSWTTVVPHGLGATPSDYKWVLRCTVATSGFNVGDIVSLPNTVDGDGARSSTIWADATNISSTGNRLVRSPTGVSVNPPTSANFEIRVYAWK